MRRSSALDAGSGLGSDKGAAVGKAGRCIDSWDVEGIDGGGLAAPNRQRWTLSEVYACIRACLHASGAHA